MPKVVALSAQGGGLEGAVRGEASRCMTKSFVKERSFSFPWPELNYQSIIDEAIRSSRLIFWQRKVISVISIESKLRLLRILSWSWGGLFF